MCINSIKKILKIIITIIFVFFTFIFLFFYIPNIDIKYNDKALELINSVHEKIITKNYNDQEIINIFPDDFLFVFWIKDLNNKWIPLIVNKKDTNKIVLEIMDNEPSVPDGISLITKEVKTVKDLNGYQYKIWLKRLNYEFFLKNIIISLIFITLVYFLFILIIEVFFNYKPIDITDDFKINNIKPDEKNNKDETLNIYKEFWRKNYNISVNLKNNFPFIKLSNIMKIGIKPEDYIKESLIISSEYFKWKNPKMYLYQDNKIIDALTKEVLDESKIFTPLNGSGKNDIFIPLFPYNKDKIFGYFYFYWDNNFDFYLSDVLYFLKFFLSDKAKSIFLFYNQYLNILNLLKDKLDKNNEVSVGLIELDNIEKLKNLLNSNHLIEQLNYNILNNIKNTFNNYLIYQVSQFFYLLIADNISKQNQINAFKDFILKPDNQSFNVSPEYGNAAVTYSCGISFKNNRNIHPSILINEAEDNLEKVKKTGGNSIAY